MISLIACIGKNREIGLDNNLIWRIPDDMRFFKQTTMGHYVVMGRKTFESIPNGLPGRNIIVFSSKKIENIESFSSLEDFLNVYGNFSEEIFIIGGSTLYNLFIKYADNLYLTEVNDTHEADTFFPEFDLDEWEKEALKTDFYNECNYSINKYTRILKK